MVRVKRIPKTAIVDEAVKKRVSKRTYPERICPHTGLKFIPTDKRQKFINEQARIDYNNDKRAVVGKTLMEHNKQIKLNEKILAQGRKRLLELGKKTLGRDLLLFSGYVFDIYSERTINNTTNKYILWAIDHGIEGIDADKESVIIRLKNTI